MLIPDNSTLVIFGASGDLTYRKLIPALYQLYVMERLPKSFCILGVSRTEYSDQAYREKLSAALEEFATTTPETLDAFCQHLHYQAIDTKDEKDYGKLAQRLESLQHTYGFDKAAPDAQSNILYYLATPPSLYSVIPANLAAHNLHDESNGWKRLIVEKPFGYDLESAQKLDIDIHAHFKEHQIYRI
ncbi:MAG: glucose-6-phosphate dehydrogenase, partial [Vibrio sp.]